MLCTCHIPRLRDIGAFVKSIGAMYWGNFIANPDLFRLWLRPRVPRGTGLTNSGARGNSRDLGIRADRRRLECAPRSDVALTTITGQSSAGLKFSGTDTVTRACVTGEIWPRPATFLGSGGTNDPVRPDHRARMMRPSPTTLSIVATRITISAICSVEAAAMTSWLPWNWR